ncbi:pentapeptide repeat-containing protein [Gloeobacter kilaueensis]|uniref:Pentapeptide repeat-containing protein n=1 Tax=Gloeobacter kilaueensis (strain ATCC BAA-2537 / CCAP 1431/1 / ULC 316 / JS1) TaxID=1183438 RepID=U5QL03_GLOK1|nr:pentapeptide repeat-containing protein [Gloeobacter kilaueensis]AGY59672.1 pentapeptide repeat-containing protein [Gloeobacter kilaueensis JS1]
MAISAHVIWHDWTHWRIVCSRCHRRLLPQQWTGKGGEEWPQDRRAAVRLLAEGARRQAQRCDGCGRQFRFLRRSYPLQDPGELVVRHRQGQHPFETIELVGGDLSTLELSGALMMEANLNGSCLVASCLQAANLTGASLIGSDLRSARLQRADLSGAVLLGANLDGSDLEDAKLIGGDLRGASLRWANLQGAQLRGALLDERSLRGARLCNTVLPDGQVVA